jgi:hypothetical protein
LQLKDWRKHVKKDLQNIFRVKFWGRFEACEQKWWEIWIYKLNILLKKYISFNIGWNVRWKSGEVRRLMSPKELENVSHSVYSGNKRTFGVKGRRGGVRIRWKLNYSFFFIDSLCLTIEGFHSIYQKSNAY